jgi:hypothetical protein
MVWLEENRDVGVEWRMKKQSKVEAELDVSPDRSDFAS